MNGLKCYEIPYEKGTIEFYNFCKFFGIYVDINLYCIAVNGKSNIDVTLLQHIFKYYDKVENITYFVYCFYHSKDYREAKQLCIVEDMMKNHRQTIVVDISTGNTQNLYNDLSQNLNRGIFKEIGGNKCIIDEDKAKTIIRVKTFRYPTHPIFDKMHKEDNKNTSNHIMYYNYVYGVLFYNDNYRNYCYENSAIAGTFTSKYAVKLCDTKYEMLCEDFVKLQVSADGEIVLARLWYYDENFNIFQTLLNKRLLPHYHLQDITKNVIKPTTPFRNTYFNGKLLIDSRNHYVKYCNDSFKDERK